VGFGAEILFVLVLGLVVLGPKRLHTMLGRAVRTKRQLEEASRGFKSQLAAELDAASGQRQPDHLRESIGDQ
jgi:Sec-independent protein translocase protein TatA